MKRMLMGWICFFLLGSAHAQTTVNIAITNDTGAALQGISVYAFNNNAYVNKSAVTDINGVASLILNDGDYRFRADKSGTQYFSAASNHCSVPSCTNASVNIPRPVSVNLSSSAGGAEAGLSVYVFNGNSYVNKSAVTDAAGVATLQLPVGDYRFRADKNGTQFFTGAVNHCSVPGCTSVDFEVPESVVVSVQGDSGPESGLNVYAFNGSSYVNKSAVTDANGEAVFTLLPGSYRFRIDKNGTQFFTDTGNHCTVAGCNAVSFSMPASVEVSVSSSAGGPEAGLNVYAFNGSSYVNKSAVTDANGLASFTLIPGNYRFRIDKNGTQYFTESVNHCSVPGCDAVAYEVPESVTINVSSSAGGVEEGLKVYAFNGNSYVNKSATTDAGGQAVFTLLPGSYRFRIDKNGTQFFTDAINHCDLPGCTAVNYEVPASVTVAVSNTAGGAEAGLNVYAFNGNAYVNKSAVTDANGHASFTLIPGDYRFRVDKAGVQYFTDIVNHCQVPGCSLVAQQLPAPLSAYVVDPALGACLDATGSANGWTSPAEVTSLSCNGQGISNLSGLSAFSNLGSLSLANNPITLLDELTGLGNLSALDLTGVTSLECSALGSLESLLGSGVISHPASCLGEGDLVFSLLNPGKPSSNQFSFSVASTPDGNLISSAITYNPFTDAYDGHVYLIDGTSGNALLEIPNPAPSGSDYFGWSVAAGDDNSIIVGAWNDDASGVNAGAVYVFDGADGSLRTTILPPTPMAGERFGYALTTSAAGNTLVAVDQVGSSGRVYVYDASGNLLHTLSSPSADTNAAFGASLASGPSGQVIVGAPGEDVGAAVDAGMVHIFDETSGALLLSIENPAAADFDAYGSVVASTLLGDVLVSARMKDNHASNDGSLFAHDSVTGAVRWSVANPLADADGQFASSIAGTPLGDVVVGAAQDDFGASDSGRVYVYSGTDGALIKTIQNPEPDNYVNFGQGLAVTPSGQIAVGAYGADGGFGKLYLFASVASGETLTPVNELPISDPALQACVLGQAAANGWATTNEVTSLNCANSDIADVAGLESLDNLETLDLTGNTDILCSDLDALETALPSTTVIRPASCNTGSGNQAQSVQNLHNAQGQRVAKTVNGDTATTVHFLYDQSSQVIAEIDASTGATLREYVYVNGQQIALVDDTDTPDEAVYFVHNDHLGTPQKITDESQAVVWDAVYQPFGEVELVSEEIEHNVRFPGQYADQESGLYYNYFRDYDPSLGRYVESDPIGLEAGFGTYLYVSNNPSSKVDPTGTVEWDATISSIGGGYYFAAAYFRILLVSECVQNYRLLVRSSALGAGTGFGGKGAAITISSKFEDFSPLPESRNVTGRFALVAAGATFSPVPGKFLGGPGVGLSFGFTQLGNAISTPGISVTLGVDLSAIAVVGKTWVNSIERLSCGCR